MKEYIKGANPYMPLWEHVPDGEPRVFEYNGEKRVYLYGSHDTVKTEYCGPDQVVWSAPVDDLTNWKCHGVCYTATDGGILYAPDVVKLWLAEVLRFHQYEPSAVRPYHVEFLISLKLQASAVPLVPLLVELIFAV